MCNYIHFQGGPFQSIYKDTKLNSNKYKRGVILVTGSKMAASAVVIGDSVISVSVWDSDVPEVTRKQTT